MASRAARLASAPSTNSSPANPKCRSFCRRARPSWSSFRGLELGQVAPPVLAAGRRPDLVEAPASRPAQGSPLVDVGDSKSPSLAASHELADRFSLMADAVYDLANASRREESQLMMRERRAGDRDQRLRHVGGNGRHTRSQTA